MLWPFIAVGLLAAAPEPDFAASLKVATEKVHASRVRMTSDGQQLLLEVDVEDVTPSAATDDVHSDHVEVWLALERLEDIGPTRFVTPSEGRTLLTVRGKDSPKELDAILRGKDSGLGGEAPESGCEESVASAQKALGTPPSKRVRAFFGLVHLGLFPDGRAPVLYDPEVYAATGLAPALAPGDLRYEATKTPQGYKLRAWLQPGALLFVPRDGVSTLRVRVDAIDSGAAGAREVLRSTSPSPKWGDPATFSTVKLSHPLSVKLVDAVPELGRPGVVPAGAKQAFESLPAFFVRTGGAWQPVSVSRASPSNYELRICAVELTDVTQYEFFPWKLGKAEPFAGPETVRVPVQSSDFSGALLVARGKGGLRAARPSGKSVLGFQFKDGTPGAIVENTEPTMGRYTSGMCGAADTTEVRLVRLEATGAQETQMLTWDTCSSPGIMSGEKAVARFPESDTGEPTPVKYTWVKPGERLRADFGGGIQVEVTWKPDGTGVEAK